MQPPLFEVEVASVKIACRGRSSSSGLNEIASVSVKRSSLSLKRLKPVEVHLLNHLNHLYRLDKVLKRSSAKAIKC